MSQLQYYVVKLYYAHTQSWQYEHAIAFIGDSPCNIHPNIATIPKFYATKITCCNNSTLEQPKLTMLP